MRKLLKVALAIGLLVAISLTITMAGATVDTSETTAIQEPPPIAVDQTETGQEILPDQIEEAPDQEIEIEPEEKAPLDDTCQNQCTASMAVYDEAHNNLASQVEELQRQIDELKAK